MVVATLACAGGHDRNLGGSNESNAKYTLAWVHVAVDPVSVRAVPIANAVDMMPVLFLSRGSDLRAVDN
eukprot:3375947-Pyramimonas_sp.AAC.1